MTFEDCRNRQEAVAFVASICISSVIYTLYRTANRFGLTQRDCLAGEQGFGSVDQISPLNTAGEWRVINRTPIADRSALVQNKGLWRCGCLELIGQGVSHILIQRSFEAQVLPYLSQFRGVSF